MVGLLMGVNLFVYINVSSFIDSIAQCWMEERNTLEASHSPPPFFLFLFFFSFYIFYFFPSSIIQEGNATLRCGPLSILSIFSVCVIDRGSTNAGHFDSPTWLHLFSFTKIAYCKDFMANPLAMILLLYTKQPRVTEIRKLSDWAD